MSEDLEFIYDAANEALVIEAALATEKDRKRLVHQLGASEFLVPRHAIVWKALRGITDRNLGISKEVIRQFVTNAGGDSSVVEYLEGILKEAEKPKNLDYHVETMQWDATRAKTLKGPIPKLFDVIRDPKGSPADVMAAARQIVRALEGSQGRSHVHRPTELHRAYVAEIASRRASRNVYPLGAPVFDTHLTEGLMPGRTTVTAGLSGAGKSTVWIAFAILQAKLGRRVMVCAWEMDSVSLLDVAISHMTGIPLINIVQGTLSDEDATRVLKASAWINAKIKFMDNPFLRQGGKRSNNRNFDLLEGYLSEAGAEVVIYDLWERMLPYRSVDDVTTALYRLQDIHVEYGIHGVVVHQLRLKDVETRADKRPTRESIKGTAAFVEVADLIIAIHRDAQFKAVDDNWIETICLKQRKGVANWAIRWAWDGSICKVSDPEEVPFDPGLEAVSEAGDIGKTVKDLQDIKSKKKRRRKIGRRE